MNPPGANPIRQYTSPLRPGTHAQIDAAAIAHNVAHLHALLRQGNAAHAARLWAVCKADAYGHGLALCLPGMESADGLAVTDIESALACRQLGWRKPILMLGACISMADILNAGLAPLHVIVDNASQLDELEKLLKASELSVWLRFSGDLHHAGFRAARYRAAYERAHLLQKAGIIHEAGHLLHYARAEDPGFLQAERRVFDALTAGLPGPRCTENSAAVLCDTDHATATSWVRSGIAIYGISPLPGITGAELGLKPAMTLLACIHAIQDVDAGQPLGYGGTFVTHRDARIGLVHCGYAQGYPRSPGPDACAMVNGRECKVVGRVSMDTLALDLSDHPDAYCGAAVTLWGAPALPVERIAASAGTIAAQLCTGLTARVPRLAAPSGICAVPQS